MIRISTVVVCLLFVLAFASALPFGSPALTTPFALRHAINSNPNKSVLDNYKHVSVRFTLRVETSSRPYAGSSRASVQFFVNGEWTSPQSLREKWWDNGANVERDFQTQAWPTHVRLIVGGTNAWGYRRILLIDSIGDKYVVLDSANGEPYGNNDFWLDGDEINVPQRDFKVPSTPVVVDFTLQIESVRSNSGGDLASAQFLINGQWTQPQVFEHVAGDFGKKDFLMTKRQTNVTWNLSMKAQAWPSKVRLHAHPSDTHNTILLIDDAGYEHVILNSSAKVHDNTEPSNSGDMDEAAHRDYAIPTARFTVQVEISKQKNAGGSRASMQFLVNGQWTSPQKFQATGFSQGAILKKEFETQAWPSQLRLINDCTDAWGYKRIVVSDPFGQQHVVLDSSNGARYGNNEFWLDGDEIDVSQRDFHVPNRKDEL